MSPFLLKRAPLLLHPERVPHLCELCGERPATVFITKIVDNDSSKHCFCTLCATDQAQGHGWLNELADEIGDAQLIEDVQDAIEQFSFETFVSQMMDQHGEESDEADPSEDSFADEDDDADDWGELDTDNENAWLEADPFNEATFLNPIADAHELTVRCPGCGTTWDRIKADGRAGCASCYGTFREQLSSVMSRVQRGAQHLGKVPRTAEKRKRRLEHLRQRRDNQLQLLQNRLKAAVAAEKYEEAAQLRDRIKIVSSTIVSE